MTADHIIGLALILGVLTLAARHAINTAPIRNDWLSSSDERHEARGLVAEVEAWMKEAS